MPTSFEGKRIGFELGCWNLALADVNALQARLPGLKIADELPHASPSQHPICNNEPAFLEIGASKHGYTVGTVRCAVLGRHPEAESLHTLAEEVVEALVAAVKPGISAAAVDAAGREVLKRSGRKGVFRHRSGYQTGINWTERGDLSLEPGASDILQSGMCW
ncbi:hypothetical protein X737_39175 [Mesorhizobium sp. L48C026A00]|nr:hypothetical protein X737_39175 [Mesorhizobium sp. L48C026A00]